MGNKSELRINVEKALFNANIDTNINFVFSDKSKSGQRIKFVGINPNPTELKRIRNCLRAQFPNQDFRVWYVNTSRNYNGLAIKIFND